MMTNKARGETALMMDGVTRRLCLTLGALAEIESGLEARSLVDIETRLRAPRAEDLIVVLGALLRGGGEDLRDEDVAAARIPLRIAADAISAAFAAAGLGAEPDRGNA